MRQVRNIFNRVLLLVLSFVSFGFGIVVLLLLAGWISPGVVSPNGATMFNQWSFFSRMRSPNPLLDILVGAICAGVGLLIFILEILPEKREPRHLLVSHDGKGQVTVARSSVQDLVQHEAATLPEVIETRQDVQSRRDGLHVHVRTSVSPEANAPQVGQRLQEKLRTSLQRHLGLPVAQVQVATQVAPLDRRPRRRVR